jgi:hypothetical protein
LVDGGATLNLVTPSLVNRLRIPWRNKRKAHVVKGPFDLQWARRETEPLDIEVEGKTTQVVFDIVDTDEGDDMILGEPWHEDYDPDIRWKGGARLRPREPSPYPTDEMGRSAEQEPRTGGTQDNALPTGPPQEASSGRKTTTRSRKSGKQHKQGRRMGQEIAIVSIDERGKLEFQEWVTGHEAAFISTTNDKFSYYASTEKDDKTGQIPDDYKGHPVFEAKHIEGLLEYGL